MAGTSYIEGRPWIRTYLTSRFPRSASVLDVGAGCGTYHTLLGDYFDVMDAVEIHRPYIARFELEKKYRNVYCEDVSLWSPPVRYDLAILGDVLEHMDQTSARTAIALLGSACGELVVMVPYMLEQGALDGVSSERHLQPDLTRGVMLERYPELSMLAELRAPHTIGIFIKNRSIWTS